MTEPTIRIVTVTPQMAADWLRFNTHNRPLRSWVVRRYYKDMQEGRWEFAADPNRFGESGALLDGQHRLAALAGVTTPNYSADFIVVTKLPDSAQMYMDQGSVRTSGQQLAPLGVKDSNVVAGGVRLYLSHERNVLFGDSNTRTAIVSRVEIEQWVLAHPELVETAGTLQLRSSDAPPSVSYAAALLFHGAYGEDVVREFFRLLAVGAGEGHPINTLDKRLQRIRRMKTATTGVEYLALFILAMNAWLEDRKITKIQTPGKWTAATFPKLRRVS